jgi:hypothetical protein
MDLFTAGLTGDHRPSDSRPAPSAPKVTRPE